jgi:hypothetical protein
MRISNKALDSELGKVIHREVIENRLMGGKEIILLAAL